MSDIGSLEATLSRERSINAELHRELSAIEYGVSRAGERIANFRDKVNNALDTSRGYLDDSANKMAASLEIQAEIQRLYVRFKAMELANKRIRDCNNRKYYDFANYARVRKIVQGLMDNLDVNLVSDRVIYKSVERQHLQTPDYWLTCALLAIMAWKNDDQPLAQRAIELAVQMDRKSSAVFFMLFNLRMKREDAALKWFAEYQQCQLKGSDQRTFLLLFSLLSKTINSSEELGPQGKEEIGRFIRQVVEASARTAGYSSEEMVNDILEHLARFVPREQPDYPMLRKYCCEYDKYVQTLMQAKANVSILEYFRSLIHVPPEERNAFIKDFIDELIAAANSQEKQVYEEIAYNETIIRMEGDVDKAKEVFGSQRLHDEREINLVYEMIEWVYGADGDDVNGQSRLSMFTLTKDLQRQAIERRTEAYRSVDRRHAQISVGEYSSVMDMENVEGELAKAESFFRQKRDDAMAALKGWKAFLGFGVAAAAAAASFFVSQLLLAVTVIGAGYGVMTLLTNRAGRKQAEAQYQEDCRLAQQALVSLGEEYDAFEKEFGSCDAYAEEILRELDTL